MSRLRVGDLWDSTHSRPEDHDMSEFNVILGMDWLKAYRVVIDCERRRVTAMRRTVLVWYFKGTSMIFCPRQYTSPGVSDS